MRLNLGLQKLIQGAKDVAAMKIVLAEEQKKLEVATTETMKMLSSLEISSAEARKEGEQASGKKLSSWKIHTAKGSQQPDASQSVGGNVDTFAVITLVESWGLSRPWFVDRGIRPIRAEATVLSVDFASRTGKVFSA